jgi:hypothetical protein
MAQATVLTNSGRAIKTNLVSGLGGTAPNYVGIGSGSTTAVVADTALTTEYTTGTWTSYARAHPTPTRTTTSVTNDTINWSATFTAGAAQSVFEAANFDAVTAGGIFIHGSFAAAVGLSSGDSITINMSQQES